MDLSYKVVSAIELANLGIALHENACTTVIVGRAFFDGSGMVPFNESIDVAAIKPLDGIGGMILNLTAKDFLFKEANYEIGFIPSSGMTVFAINNPRLCGDVCGIPKIADTPTSNLQRIPRIVPVIVDYCDQHRDRGRGNTYVAEVGGKTGALHRNGKTHFIPYIEHLVSYS